MLECAIRIRFISDWQISSGLGNGPVADSVLIRDDNGIPYIPGRAVKGALREGAWRLGLCRNDLAKLVNYLWGTASTERISNVPGRLTAGSAYLPQDLENWLLGLDPVERSEFVSDMTILRAQTALDKNRQVVPKSLRSLECGIPGIYFTSHICVNASEIPADWLNVYLGAVCASVKSMGADRARGLGDCELYPVDRPSGKITVPPPLDMTILQPMEVEE